MALTVGSGPFGRSPAGSFNFTYDSPPHTLYFERSPRRIRVVVGGEVVADSTDAMLMHETGLMPVYYLPEADVRADVLTATDHTTHCPFKGDAVYWSVRVDGDERPNAVWSYQQPFESAPPLAGYLAFDWDAVDAFYEEDERIGVHPRDPYHRVDVVASDRDVTVRVGETVIAESSRPAILFETGLAPRYYLPEADVRTELLEPSETVTSCPYKGTTSRYHSIRVDGALVEDAIWVYDHPNDEAAPIAGLLAFYDEKVELETTTEPFAAPR